MRWPLILMTDLVEVHSSWGSHSNFTSQSGNDNEAGNGSHQRPQFQNQHAYFISLNVPEESQALEGIQVQYSAVNDLIKIQSHGNALVHSLHSLALSLCTMSALQVPVEGIFIDPILRKETVIMIHTRESVKEAVGMVCNDDLDVVWDFGSTYDSATTLPYMSNFCRHHTKPQNSLQAHC